MYEMCVEVWGSEPQFACLPCPHCSLLPLVGGRCPQFQDGEGWCVCARVCAHVDVSDHALLVPVASFPFNLCTIFISFLFLSRHMFSPDPQSHTSIFTIERLENTDKPRESSRSLLLIPFPEAGPRPQGRTVAPAPLPLPPLSHTPCCLRSDSEPLSVSPRPFLCLWVPASVCRGSAFPMGAGISHIHAHSFMKPVLETLGPGERVSMGWQVPSHCSGLLEFYP